ncbi:class I SAM-dependent methyltransferase [Frateuria sp. GZRe12]|uniref:class I SAM-dependent methyltransferase n=1 Tax=Frateuria sp. GZRe12 TaxID=3351533 RepID=UPI003EDBF826
MNRSTTTGLLGDTAARDYVGKLRRFNAFAAPELRQAVASLALRPGMRVLDAGCGSGEAMAWLSSEAGPDGIVVGIDLALAHARAARAIAPPGASVVQANLAQLPLAHASVDLVWSVNTLNHLRDPVDALQTLATLLRPGGRVALGQSSLLPDMYFAWDARLERLVNEAVRQYYRDRYQVSERELADVRALVGRLRHAGLRNVTARTFMIERVAPLDPASADYLLETIFSGTWGERLQPYLDADDYTALVRLCDPRHPDFALRRPDFHFLQSFTLAVGEA